MDTGWLSTLMIGHNEMPRFDRRGILMGGKKMAYKTQKQGQMSTSEVKKMQQTLIDAGYDVGSTGADGIWGANTAAALSQYKKDTGGSNSYGNSVGNETLQKLYGTGSSGTGSSGNKNTGSGSGTSGKTSAGSSSGGNTYTGSSGITWSDEVSPNAALGSGVTALPGGYTIPANQYSDSLYQQAVLNEQMKQQQQAMMDAMDRQYAEQQEALRRRTEATVSSIEAYRPQVQKDYEEAQRQAYINAALQQNQMGDYLAAAGFSGGMAESTAAQIANNYADNRRKAASERDAANIEIDRMVADARVSGDTSLADAANNYYSNYLAALENQQQLDYQLNQNLLGQIEAEQERKIAAAQQQYEREQYEMEKQENTNQQKAAQDFDTFLNTYQGKYGKKATYEQWIKNLQGMNDPYGYNAQKIAYLRQYINKTFGAGTTTQKAASSTESQTPAKPGGVSDAAKQVVNDLRSKMSPGVTPEARANAVQNAITKGGFAGTPDEEYILSAFGY